MLEAEFHRENLLVTPLIALGLIGCDNPECAADLHGIAIELGWLFWTVRIGIPLWV